MSVQPIYEPVRITPEQAEAIRARIAEARERERIPSPAPDSDAKASPLHEPFRLPDHTIVGSCGELARVLSEGTEVPPEFVFAAALTLFGSLACEGRLELDIGIRVEPRLYTVLLGESGDVKKSTAIKRTVEFFKSLRNHRGFLRELNGVASAEGLARELGDVSNTVLVYDEFRAFLDKCKIQGSALLSAVASLFEGGDWDNATKSERHSVHIRNAKLSLLAACTTQTWQGVWGRDAIAIGLPNRLLVIHAEARPRVAWPKSADSEALAKIARRIEQQLARLPLRLGITDEARRAWEAWYVSRPSSEHVKRLDTIGFRLMALLTLSMDKQQVDVEVVSIVADILDYELAVRMYQDPIDADSVVAKLEERIRRAVVHGPMTRRDLRRKISADREGIWAFERALENLHRAGDIKVNGFIAARQPSADLSAPS